MMERKVAISILQDIQNRLMESNWKEKSLRTIDNYTKELKVATNDKIRKLREKHCQYSMLYGEAGKKTIKLAKKIDEEIQKIYDN